MLDATTVSLNDRTAARVRELRAQAALSLESLAQRSGVSRSMISLIERGESSATAVVLEKLATALGVTLASLFDAPGDRAAPPGPVARAAAQPPWQDPGSGYVRRNVSPAGWPVTVTKPKLRIEAPTQRWSRSTTATRRPRSAAASAWARPTMPAPAITTS
jgi:transcriptional regulator with XRE-family HTH domain